MVSKLGDYREIKITFRNKKPINKQADFEHGTFFFHLQIHGHNNSA